MHLAIAPRAASLAVFLNLRTASDFGPLADVNECRLHLSQQMCKLRFSNCFLRIHHHIHRSDDLRQVHAGSFAQAAFDPVPLHRAAQRPAYCESDAGAARRFAGPAAPVKNRKIRREYTPTLPINAIKRGMFEQPRSSQ